MASSYAERSARSYEIYGVSPRTRTRLRNANPNLSPDQVDEILKANRANLPHGERASRADLVPVREAVRGAKAGASPSAVTRRLKSYATFGVSPTTRKRLQTLHKRVAPAEVDEILRLNGRDGDRARIAQIRRYILELGHARALYDTARKANGKAESMYSDPVFIESQAIYFAMQAWAASNDFVLVDFEDSEKWEAYL